MRKIVEQFNPSWGATVMGTGVLSILAAGLGGGYAIIALVLFALNTIVLVYALVCWILMWFITPKKIRAILDNANMLVFLPTVPIGIVVYANNAMALKARFFTGLDVLVPGVAWIIASIIILVLAVHFIDRIFTSSTVEIQHSTFGWLIPPVALLIIPLGAPLFVGAFGQAARTLVFVSVAIWGAGFFAYLFVNAAVTHRYFFHQMPVNQMTPSVWVGLGPVGAGAAGLLSLARTTAVVHGLTPLADVGVVLAVFMWGFGLVWYFVSLVLTARKAFFESIPYTMGWWAFTFPLGAFALATRLLFQQTGMAALEVFFWVLLANLALFWLITSYRTVKFVVRGA